MEVFLTLNGIGHGHLTRAAQACRWLRRSGSRPVIFLQGAYPKDLELKQPGLSMPALYTLSPEDLLARAAEIGRYAALSEPAIVIEDTHPALVAFPPNVRRFLMVRPASLELMRWLEANVARVFQRFIVCDDPQSPTWPFAPDATAEILSWRKWRCIGPIFRRSTTAGISRVRDRYQIAPDEHVFVFSMGAGGEKRESGDRARFLEAAAKLGAEIRASFAKPRLLFVCGPLFPKDLHPPAGFEEIREEPDMPSLLALALGAVIRPGFNTTWEAIAGETPFLTVEGTTTAEPVTERLAQMEKCGLDLPRSIAQWLDPAWLERYRSACRAISARFSGQPAQEFQRSLAAPEKLSSIPRGTVIPIPMAAGAVGLYDLKKSLPKIAGQKRLLIRMDDVVELDSTVEWLLRICRERDLRASLEIIPYLSKIDRASLDRLDPSGTFEISQHGYAHLPQRAVANQLKGELPEDTARARAILSRGYRKMRRTFGDRFKRGYSAPYDGLPPWLPDVWKEVGGGYISWMYNDPQAGAAIPGIRMDLDPWDWDAMKDLPLSTVVAHALESIERRGYVGLVLHPALIKIDEHKQRLERLIGALVEGGCCSGFPSEAAGLPS